MPVPDERSGYQPANIPLQTLQQSSRLPHQAANLSEQQQPYDSMVRFPERHAWMTPLILPLLHEDGKVMRGAEVAYPHQSEYTEPALLRLPLPDGGLPQKQRLSNLKLFIS